MGTSNWTVVMGACEHGKADSGTSMMEEISRLMSTRQLFTTPYNLWCNGLWEKVNGAEKGMVKKMCQERPRDWDWYLSAVLFTYREIPQASIGFVPFELLYRCMVRGPMQVQKELWTGECEDETQNKYQYVLELRNRLEETCQLASLMEAQGWQKHQYSWNTRDRRFQVGQKVLVLLPMEHNKLTLRWWPYTVQEVVNRMDYRIDVNAKSKVYHANLLKRYHEREQAGSTTVAGTDEELLSMAVVEEDDVSEGEPSEDEGMTNYDMT